MRTLVTATIALILLSASAASSEQATCEFDHSKLASADNRLSWNYGGFGTVAVGGTCVVPVKTVYVELAAEEKTANVHYAVVGRSEVLGTLDNTVDLSDIPTSAGDSYQRVASSAHSENFGRKAVQITGEVSADHRRFAALALFPVTLDTRGNLTFATCVDVFVGARKLAADDLLPESVIERLTLAEKGDVTSSCSGNTAEYLIVTGAQFLEPLGRLRTYRTTTGYRVDIKAIDEILSASSGRDDAEKLREYLKGFYADGGRYVLLVGDETVLLVRYAYQFDTEELPPLPDLSVSDLYFADLSSDWDPDGDGVFGERDVNLSVMAPELRVGRLPFNDTLEVHRYIDKLIAYETNPGDGDPAYLTRAFFFSADQMRDYAGGGQHGRIAQAFPAGFVIDTVAGVEASSGSDQAPTNLAAGELEPILSSGFGVVNILAHGRSDGIAVRTAGYNNWPKSNFLTEDADAPHGSFSRLAPNGKVALYYSVACNNGGFDLDQPPANEVAPNLAQTLLGLKDAGAIGFVGHSRSGWVSSSHILQKVFFDSLFAHPELPAIDAMYKSQAANYYYRDLVYGQNFYGDPALRIYRDIPRRLAVTFEADSDRLDITVTDGGAAAGNVTIVLSEGTDLIGRCTTDGNGRVAIVTALDEGRTYTVSALKDGFTVAQKSYTPGLAAGVDERSGEPPQSWSLAQNYPNPFNPSTTIMFDLPSRAQVTLVVYNILGQKVATLAEAVLSAGSHLLEWGGRDDSGQEVAGGVYFYRLEADGFTAVKKMILLK